MSRYLWLIITALTIVLNLTAGGMFSTRLVDPIQVRNHVSLTFSDWYRKKPLQFQVMQKCSDYIGEHSDAKDITTNYLISTMLMPIVYFWGVIFLLMILCLWCCLAAAATDKRIEHSKKRKNARMRTLSEDEPSDYGNT